MKSLFCLFLGFLSTNGRNQMAEISFYGSNEKMMYQNIAYYLKPEKSHIGVKFGVYVYGISLNVCTPKLDDSIPDYFAAYVTLPTNCVAEDILNDLISHGADFIFLDVREASNVSLSVTSNKYDVPVFIVDDRIGSDIFNLGKEENTKRYISILFLANGLNEKDNSAKLTFFYEPAYAYSERFLSIIGQVYSTLRDKAVFEPMVVTFSSNSDELKSKHCVTRGNYCSIEPEIGNASTGREIILEGIRQKCIYKISMNDYFAYMSLFFITCLPDVSESCSRGLCYSLGIHFDEVKKCLNESFSKSESDFYENENSLLREEREAFRNFGVKNYPEIYINGKQYSGTLSYFDLLLSLCSALHEESKDCRNLSLEKQHEVNLTTLVLVSLTLFGIGVAGLAVLCRKIARKKYLMELSKSIDKYVTEYSRINDDSTRTEEKSG